MLEDSTIKTKQKHMSKFPRRIALLGSTGSIGQQTLDVVRCFPEHFRVVALAARRNIELLVAQAARAALPDVLLGEQGLLEVATHPEADIVVAATSGLVGLNPTLAAIRAG